ncbi:MAG: exodeoxyribonuclease VII large subunit [Alphaproteobacteria bacterium]|nr:exodeoxyribonuclease VII large subunit [Alphaproteobacteria bacterium]
MTDTDARPPSNVPEFTVSEISGALKRTVEETFSLVRVRGEISGFKRHSSGHLYFALKDADAVMDAVCWRGQAARLGMAPEDGMEVIATGRLTTYPGRSKYQMVVERMELAGQGALLKLLEDRRRKLAAEGLFDQGRKRPIPFLPRVIGVVTSPTGAVIRDILHRLADRFPSHVLLWPVAVQGDGAAAQVAAAIAGFNALPQDGQVARPDLLIVARGGGSVEDLWAFNEEVVVRAAAASAIPLISAVGHETDTTLIDFASDLRAPTPTAAAEMAVPVRAELINQVTDCGSRLLNALTRGIEERRLRVEAIARALPHPRRVIEEAWLKLDDRAERLRLALPNLMMRHQAELDKVSARLTHALDKAKAAEAARLERDGLRLTQAAMRLPDALARTIERQGQRLESQGMLLESYSYRKVLDRGYAVVRDAAGHVVAAADAAPGAHWRVEFKDGDTPVTVGESAAPPPAAKPKPKGREDGRQGSLL